MEIPKQGVSLGHRGACDQCSQRKVRCAPANGACQNCIAWGKTCTYSPKIPSGRPRKRAPTATKDGTTKSSEKALVEQQQPPIQAPEKMYKWSSQDRPVLNRGSASLSSIESQLVTPPDETSSLSVQDMEMDLDMSISSFPTNFLDENMMSDQDFFSNMLFSDQDKFDTVQTEPCMSPFPQHVNMHQSLAILDNKIQMKAKPPSFRPSIQRSTTSFTTPHTKISGPSVPTFTSLLTTVMDLRSKYDSLKSFTQSYPGLGQKLFPDTIRTTDQTITSFAQYFDHIEPYLASTHRKLSGLATDAKRQQCNNIQATIQMIVAGSSIMVETSYALHELLHMLLSAESKAISVRLDSVLRFSTIDFHVRRCVHALGLIADILSCGGSDDSSPDNTLQDLNMAKSSAESLRKEFALAIEELKTPVF